MVAPFVLLEFCFFFNVLLAIGCDSSGSGSGFVGHSGVFCFGFILTHADTIQLPAISFRSISNLQTREIFFPCDAPGKFLIFRFHHKTLEAVKKNGNKKMK